MPAGIQVMFLYIMIHAIGKEIVHIHSRAMLSRSHVLEISTVGAGTTVTHPAHFSGISGMG